MSKDLSQIEQEIIELEHEWIKAVGERDGAALDRILDDDFLIAGWLPEGKVGDKKHYIEDCLTPVDVKESPYSFDRWRIRVFGDVMVVNCLFKCHALVAGKEWGGVFLFTDLWIKRTGLKAVARHSSPVFAP